LPPPDGHLPEEEAYLVSTSAIGAFKDHIRSLFADHINGCDNEKAGYSGKHGSVNHAKVSHATHTEFAVQNRPRVVICADFAGARGVMAPGFILDPLK
jgi:hypothetical protein